MKPLNRLSLVAVAVAALAALPGCSSEQGIVSFSYAVKPTKGLPDGMKVITVMPSQLGPATDPKWSDFVATKTQQMVSESRSRFGTDVKVADRRDTDVTFDEADLAASGMSTAEGGAGGKLLAAQGAIRSNINVLIDRQKDKKRTISGISGGGFGSFTSGSVQTEEVETVRRTMTVQADFRLIDTANNQIWEQLPPTTLKREDATDAGVFFGSSELEGELESTDTIIGELVEEAVRRFLSRLMTIRVEVREVVESSANENCQTGVKMLRAEMYDDALTLFKAAMADNPEDHRAAFGAGVASEASGKYSDALNYYKKACMGEQNDRYMRARDRMKEYGTRAMR